MFSIARPRSRRCQQPSLEGLFIVPLSSDTRAVDIGNETRLLLMRKMLECRYLEKRANDLFLQNLVKGTTHLALGQEAIATGFGVAMQAGDYTFCTYRGHNHTLVRGAPMTGILGELMGRECGLLRGKGGSMHLTSVDHGVMGSYAIIGAHLPVAAGAAWSAQYRGTDQVAVCFFGDGTTNIGAFHEALNLSAVMKLPVVFVCENNLYMEYTPISQVTAVANPAADRAGAYGLEPIVLDGNDVEEVFRAATRALELARSGAGPSLIEAMTYRHGGHSRADPGKYRPKEEVAAWLAKDPIPRYRRRLLESGVGEERIAAIEEETSQAVDRATEEAKSSAFPPIASVFADLWADGGSSWRN
jgi:TPP-dependent pyruvate/acetoin dehydrogenase alpha subunit